MSSIKLRSSQFVLSYNDTIDFLKILKRCNLKFEYISQNHVFQCTSMTADFECKIRLPTIFHILNHKCLDAIHLRVASSEIPTFLILLIRAGYASIGLSQNGVIIHHKVIKKYMVRKKQGKAQLTYQALKGKSRGGAKLRLSRTREFFEEINSKLQEWYKTRMDVDLIFYQCSPRLWSELFKAKTNLPFDKADRRIHRIPLTTNKPTFRELKRINWLLLHGRIEVRAQEKIKSTEGFFALLLTDFSE